MNFLEKLKARTEEVIEIVKDKVDSVIIDDEIREQRLEICKTCPNYIHATSTCKRCGCFMVAKTHLSSAECPIGKW